MVFIACFDDPFSTRLHWQTAVSTRQQSIQSLNSERSSGSFRTTKQVIPNPQPGDFTDLTVLHIVYSQKFGEGGVDLI